MNVKYGILNSNGKKYHVYETPTEKVVRGEDYNCNFRKTDGFFQRWGKDQNEDPVFSPIGPEIFDIEISDGRGCPISCAFCSPSGTLVNTPYGKEKIENLKSDDLVLGFDVYTNSPRIQTIEETYCREYSGDLICIELDSGETLKLTPDHLIYTKNRGWIRSELITEDDELVSF